MLVFVMWFVILPKVTQKMRKLNEKKIHLNASIKNWGITWY